MFPRSMAYKKPILNNTPAKIAYADKTRSVWSEARCRLKAASEFWSGDSYQLSIATHRMSPSLHHLSMRQVTHLNIRDER